MVLQISFLVSYKAYTAFTGGNIFLNILLNIFIVQEF